MRGDNNDLIDGVKIGGLDVGGLAKLHVRASLETSKALVHDCGAFSVVLRAGDQNGLAQLGARPSGHEWDERALTVGDLDRAGRLVRGVLDDNLDARERALGGRDLVNDVGREEGGSAVLVGDGLAVGKTGREVHEALDSGGGVRHGVSSFSLPGGGFLCCHRAGGLVFGGGLFPADNMYSTRVDASVQAGKLFLWRGLRLGVAAGFGRAAQPTTGLLGVVAAAWCCMQMADARGRMVVLVRRGGGLEKRKETVMALVNAQWNGEGFVLSEDELVRLLESDMELAALGSGGVDNWDWYDDSCCDYLDAVGFDDFEDAARDAVAQLKGGAAAE